MGGGLTPTLTGSSECDEAITWAFVTTRPSSLMTKPDPYVLTIMLGVVGAMTHT